MSEGEAKALVSKCDKDGSTGIDFAEFAQLWEALHGEAEVNNKKFMASPPSTFYLRICFGLLHITLDPKYKL